MWLAQGATSSLVGLVSLYGKSIFYVGGKSDYIPVFNYTQASIMVYHLAILTEH